MLLLLYCLSNDKYLNFKFKTMFLNFWSISRAKQCHGPTCPPPQHYEGVFYPNMLRVTKTVPVQSVVPVAVGRGQTFPDCLNTRRNWSWASSRAEDPVESTTESSTAHRIPLISGERLLRLPRSELCQWVNLSTVKPELRLRTRSVVSLGRTDNATMLGSRMLAACQEGVVNQPWFLSSHSPLHRIRIWGRGNFAALSQSWLVNMMVFQLGVCNDAGTIWFWDIILWNWSPLNENQCLEEVKSAFKPPKMEEQTHRCAT